MTLRILICFLTFSLFLIDGTRAQNTSRPATPLIKISKAPQFNLPLECVLGEDCWVMNYVDMGADDNEAIDPACFGRTYDGHKGTDFMVLDEKTMEDGVQVIAPRAGTVTRVRDGEPDQWSTKEQLDIIRSERKECGNAVLIDHENDVQTIYCHLKKNSIIVEPNQSIDAGEKIAEIGLSGMTQFPHLHFGIIKDGQVIDPFTGLNNNNKCGTRQASLWNKNIEFPYQPFVIQNIGFNNDIPKLSNIEKDGEPLVEINVDSEILTFWVVLFGLQPNDIIKLEIKDPNDKIFAVRNITQDKERARQFYYAGRKTSSNPLMEGVYTGEVTIQRKHKGQIIKDQKFTAILVRGN